MKFSELLNARESIKEMLVERADTMPIMARSEYQNEIIRMARDAGFMPGWCELWASNFERFADTIAAEKQEQCALIASAARDGYADRGVNLMACAADFIVCAIRAQKDDSGSEG